MSVSGADDIDGALEKLSGLDMKQAVADAIQLVRSAAVNNCSVNTGELRQSIFADVEGNSEKAYLLDKQSLCSLCGIWYRSERPG